MDRLGEFLRSSVPSITEGQGLQFNSQLVELALKLLFTYGTIYLGYLYLARRREAPVKFDVPLPPELRPDWEAKGWDDVKGEDKKILEGQVQGVSGG